MNRKQELTLVDLARQIHNMHCDVNSGLGDCWVQPPFDALPADKQQVTLNLARLILAGGTYEQAQTQWVKWMEAQGWEWGPVKDPSASPKPTHPDMVPWGELNDWGRRKLIAAFHLVRDLTSAAA